MNFSRECVGRDAGNMAAQNKCNISVNVSINPTTAVLFVAIILSSERLQIFVSLFEVCMKLFADLFNGIFDILHR